MGLFSRNGKAPPEIRAAFDDELRSEQLRLIRLGFGIGAFLYVAFWGLDYFQASEFLATFLLIRVVAAASVLALVFTTYTRLGENATDAIGMLLLLVASLGISLMCMFLGGFISDYYAGLMLCLLFAGLFMPWRLSWIISYCLINLIAYVALNAIPHGITAAAASPLFFLGATSLAVCIATAAANKKRMQTLQLRFALEKANVNLKELDEAKMRFFANVSHELRTPLMLILGPLHDLSPNLDRARFSALVDSMKANGNRLLRQVNMILDFTKLEAGALKPKFEAANLESVLSGVVMAARPYAQSKSIVLEFRTDSSVDDSTFDPEQIETVAANLLSNALKFTPSAGTVTVAIQETADEVVFSVADSGPGIDAAEHEKIFSPFHQVDNKLTREAGGTGLGLALVQEIVRLHKGKVTLDSKVGKGSTFRVAIPKSPDVLPDRRRSPRRREDQFRETQEGMLTAHRFHTKPGRLALLADLEEAKLNPSEFDTGDLHPPENAPRILLVEDHADLRTYIRYHLGGAFRVDTAENGVEGLKKARENRPDLIVSDIMMPKMDGFAFRERLKQDAALRDIPLIFLTAKSGQEAEIEGLGKGAVDYVTKPFHGGVLAARIRAQIASHNMQRELDDRTSRLAAIGQMIGGLMHDLRTPLNAAIGFAELAQLSVAKNLSTDQSMGQISEDLDTVVRSAKRAVRMAQEINDFARGGGMQLNAQPVKLTDYLREVSRDLRQVVEPSGIAFVLDFRVDDALELRLDKERMHRVLENLMVNARDAICTEGTGVGHHVWLSVEEDADEVRIGVRDDGPGIPEAVRERLFEPFVTYGKKNGTGLGLSVAQNLVRAHGGVIDVEDGGSDGRGAKLTLRFKTGASSSAPRPEDLARILRSPELMSALVEQSSEGDMARLWTGGA